LPSLLESTPPHSPLLPLPPYSLIVDVSTPTLQVTIEGMTRNFALDDAEVGDYGLISHNIAPMRGSASVAEEAPKDGF
jgi:hypothetical protein